MNSKKKNILRIGILVVAIISLIAYFNTSYGVFAFVGIMGVGAVLVWGIQLIMVAVALTGQALITTITALTNGWNTGVTGIKSILFNESATTTASFFSTPDFTLGLDINVAQHEGGSSLIHLFETPIYKITESVTEYYYIIRNLSIAILLFVLLYIGIRMAISTVASEEAKYKKMLGNWVVSLAIIFVLHFIMILTLYFNNILVSVLRTFADDVNVLDYVGLTVQATKPVMGFAEALVLCMAIGMELTFLFMYIKRIITLAFLIVISPLITITYSIDKIGDGRSQALNTWLKEFIFTVLIQPFHCVIYIVLVQTVINAMSDTSEDPLSTIGSWILGDFELGTAVIYILMLNFMREAEGIVKKIFNIQSDSMPGFSAMAGLTLGVASKLGSAGSKRAAKSARKKGKEMPDMKEEQGKQELTPQQKEREKLQKELTATQKNAKAYKDSGNYAQEAAERAKASNLVEQIAILTKGEKIEKEIEEQQRKQQEQMQQERQQEFSRNHPKLAKEKENIEKGGKNLLRFIGGDDALEHPIKTLATTSAKWGATAAAFGIAYGMADEQQAIAAGLLASSGADRIEGALQEHKDNLQLEQNEEVYQDLYDEAVEEYRKVNANASNDEILNNILQMYEQYEQRTIKIDEMKPWQRKLITSGYEKMYDSYDIAGVDKPEDKVKLLTQKAAWKNAVKNAGNNNGNS